VKIRVLWFGRPASDPYRSQVATYRSRVRRRWPAEDLALRPAVGGRAEDPRRALADEAERVRAQLAGEWRMAVLDERGQPLTSDGLASWLAGEQDAGTRGLGFVIGSDLGVEERLKREAGHVISLSPMTLPHQIARLVLWEQLFRASSILQGGGYHRHSVQ
jgi:23S rRNA (pseudouridine1915-N3)-methyltransferase